jgi:hypothetical protein
MVEIIALMMEAVKTSETPVSFYQTTPCNILEDSQLYTSAVKSHVFDIYQHHR